MTLKYRWLVIGCVIMGASDLCAQDHLDAELADLTERLSREGATRPLAELARTEVGQLLLKEKVNVLVAGAIARIDRDPMGHYERLLFSEDAHRLLTLRAERKEEVNRMVRRLRQRESLMTEFQRRADEVLALLKDDSEPGKLMKEYWQDERYRMALFQRFALEAQELDVTECLDVLWGKTLRRQPDGRLSLINMYRDEIAAHVDAFAYEIEMMKQYEEQAGQIIARSRDPGLRSNAAKLILCRKLARAAAEGIQEPDLSEISGEIRERIVLLNQLSPALDQFVKHLDSTDKLAGKLKGILKSMNGRILVLDRVADLQAGRIAARDAFFNQLREDMAAAGRNSTEAMKAEVQALLDDLHWWGAALEDIAERCGDPSVADLLRSKMGISLVQEYFNVAIERLKEEIRSGGVKLFIGLYLVPDGHRYVLRPERTVWMDELSRRAVELQKRLDQAGKESE